MFLYNFRALSHIAILWAVDSSKRQKVTKVSDTGRRWIFFPYGPFKTRPSPRLLTTLLIARIRFQHFFCIRRRYKRHMDNGATPMLKTDWRNKIAAKCAPIDMCERGLQPLGINSPLFTVIYFIIWVKELKSCVVSSRYRLFQRKKKTVMQNTRAVRKCVQLRYVRRTFGLCPSFRY